MNLPNFLMMSPAAALGGGSALTSLASYESLRPILTGTVGPPGHVLIAWAAANWMRSATPTCFSLARFPIFPQYRSRPRLCMDEHSFARINDPSQDPGKQSWKAPRIAARAASVHWPSAKNCPVRMVEISLQTAGQPAFCCWGWKKSLNQSISTSMVRFVFAAADCASPVILKACTVLVAARAVMKMCEVYIIYERK